MVQARAAIAAYEVEMVPVVLHTGSPTCMLSPMDSLHPNSRGASKAGTELAAVFRWVHNKGLSLNGQIQS